MIFLSESASVPVAADPASERIVAGEPNATVTTTYSSADGRFATGTWTCTPGRWRVAYDEEEYCRIITGRGAVIDANGVSRSICAGDEFVIPAGFTGEWEVDEVMAKIWVVMLP